MAFRKYNHVNEDNNPPLARKENSRYTGKDPLVVSAGSFNAASLAVSYIFTVVLYFIFYLKKTWLVGDSDAQTITSFAGGLSALMIAIPLFLKDLHRGSTFWKQFYLIAFIMVITSALGIYCFLYINEKPLPANIEVYFVLSLVVSVNTNTVAILARNLRYPRLRLMISINPELCLVFSVLAFLPGIIFAPGHRVLHAFLMLTILGLYLIIVLMSALLFQMIGVAVRRRTTAPAPSSSGQQIKWAIQSVVNQYKDQALTEQQLLDKLRKEQFKDRQEIIGATSVQLFVSEMDMETDPAEPMVKIYERNYDLVIPRVATSVRQRPGKRQTILPGHPIR